MKTVSSRQGLALGALPNQAILLMIHIKYEVIKKTLFNDVIDIRTINWVVCLVGSAKDL